MRPVLKWSGGKSRLLAQIEPLLPSSWHYFHEPFLGSGAVFFSFSNRSIFPSVLSDSNDDLMTFYRTLRDDVDSLIFELGNPERYTYEEATYYATRAWEPSTAVQRAARFIFLNKTCFNGLYRVNRKGKFNVSFGKFKTTPNFRDIKLLTQSSDMLQGVTIKAGDFRQVLELPIKDDFVFIDPPYYGAGVGYSAEPFTLADHQALRESAQGLHTRGVNFMMTHSDIPEVRELWDDFNIVEVSSSSTISVTVAGRKKRRDIVVRNFS